MGCTFPPCPVETPVSRLPPPLWALVHLMMGTYARCGRVLRASFVAFRCVSVCFFVFVSFHVRLNALFQSICLLVWRNNSCLQPSNGEFARCALFAFQRSQWWPELFFVLALSLLWWSAAIVWVLWALIECLLLFVAVLRCSALSWATQWRLEQCVSLFFLLLKTACDQAKQLFRSCVSALTECSSASCGEAKQLFESSVHPLSGFFPALYRANFRSRWFEKKELNTM